MAAQWGRRMDKNGAADRQKRQKRQRQKGKKAKGGQRQQQIQADWHPGNGALPHKHKKQQHIVLHSRTKVRTIFCWKSADNVSDFLNVRNLFLFCYF
jgi:hypothetical protein